MASQQQQQQQQQQQHNKLYTNTTTARPRYNIAFCTDFFHPGFGGVESHTYALGTCLIKLGHKVVIVTRSQWEKLDTREKRRHLNRSRRSQSSLTAEERRYMRHVESGNSSSNDISLVDVYRECNGVRYMSNGLKVYYVPYHSMQTPSGPTTIPVILSMWPILRNIFIRERIDIVHGHQCTSNIGLESLLHAKTMGLKCCFTDHSLFGFSDTAGIHINKVLKAFMNDVDHAICVSYTSRENTVMRTFMNPYKVSVIPHAVDMGVFRPRHTRYYGRSVRNKQRKRSDRGHGTWRQQSNDHSSGSGSGSGSDGATGGDQSPWMSHHDTAVFDGVMGRSGNIDALVSSSDVETIHHPSSPIASGFSDLSHAQTPVTIVTVTRLVYRKGADLLCAVVPVICKRFPHVNFVIGGGGPKEVQFEQMREKHGLYDRVELLGPVPHAKVRNVLVRGQIFINCSLTEAFCIALIEAASCGLFVVSTRVGGVPEVLPEEMMSLAEPNVDSIVDVLSDAIVNKAHKVDPWQFHENIKRMYNWNRVAQRTERIYDKIMATPDRSVFERMHDHFQTGPIYGILLILIMAIEYLILLTLEWVYPRDEIDHCVDIHHHFATPHHPDTTIDSSGSRRSSTTSTNNVQ